MTQLNKSTYLPSGVLTHILSYCGETYQQKRDRLWKDIRIERRFYKKGDSYARIGYYDENFPEHIYYLAIGNKKYCNVQNKMDEEVSPIWKIL